MWPVATTTCSEPGPLAVGGAWLDVYSRPMSTSGPLESTSPLYGFAVRTIDGEQTTLDFCRGHVLLVVNVASHCGFTPQYQGLEALYRKYASQGLLVLGFPCNQFAGQEPGSEADIRTFCSTTYDVTFPLFAKLEVNGEGTHPLYQWLKSQQKGILGTETIKWNFTKFLVDRAGRVVARFAPRTTPEELEPEIERLLG
jgi:glutathione peroxidase